MIFTDRAIRGSAFRYLSVCSGIEAGEDGTGRGAPPVTVPIRLLSGSLNMNGYVVMSHYKGCEV
jgi:hypothetical protein